MSQIATTIRDQIGHRALVMMGARDLMVTEGGQGLRFKVGANPKKVSLVEILLFPDDTYRVRFIRAIKSHGEFVPTFATLVELESIYVEDLRQVLESNTGLYLSL